VYKQVKHIHTSREVDDVAGAQESTYFVYALYTCTYVCTLTYNTHAHCVYIYSRTIHMRMCVYIDVQYTCTSREVENVSGAQARVEHLVPRWCCCLHTCDMTPWYARHDSFGCVTWLTEMCDMTHAPLWCCCLHYVWLDSFICVIWLIHMCAAIHSHVQGEWFIHVFMTHSCASLVRLPAYVWHDSLTWATCVTRLTQKPLSCCCLHARIWPDSFICIK